MTRQILSIATLWALCACEPSAAGIPAQTEPGGTVEVVSERSQDAWLAGRREAMAKVEAQSSVLAAARAELQGRKLGIQRDAAICLQARHVMDRDLRRAMQAGDEFGPALDQWHARAHGVAVFCDYALTVGAQK